jgi:outer membrane receptor for ferrienterochelin and colicin
MKTLLLSLLACASITVSNAQLDSAHVDVTELSLDELQNVTIVTASKNAMQAGQAPATAYVVTEEQIRIRGYRSLLDILLDAPDFKVDDRVYSLNRNIITMRGIDGQEKFIIMLDGVRISSPTNESLPIMENYPVNLAKQVEIIFGPASALYGADAFSGIINIISKKAEFTSLRAEATAIAGSQGLYNGNAFISKKLGKEVTVTLSGQYFYDKGVNMSEVYKSDSLWDLTSHRTGTFNTIFGPMTPVAPVKNEFSSPLTAYNVFGSLTAGDFEFSVFSNRSQNSTALENTPSNAVHNKDVFIGRSVSMVNAKHRKTINNLTLATTLAASQYKEDPKTNYRNMFSGMEPAYKYAYGSMIQVEEQIEWKINTNTDLVGGAIFQSFMSLPESTDLQNPVSESHSIEGTFLNTPAYYRPEGLPAKFYAVKYYNAGGYLQLQQQIGEKVNMTLGARYDHNSRFGSTFNPRVGVVANLSGKTTLKAMAGTAYLAPPPGSAYSYYGTFYTLDSGRTYRSNFMHLPNPGVKPMTSTNMEISLRQFFGKSLSVTADVYYSIVKNIVEPEADNTTLYNGKFLGWDVDYIEIFVNEGEERITGGSINLDFQKRFNRASLRAYSYLSLINGTEKVEWTDNNGAEVERDAEIDNQISHVMWKLGAEITVGNFSASPRMILNSRQNLGAFEDPENPDKRQTLPGYALVNVAVAYKLGKVQLFANITNALNTKYTGVSVGMDLKNPSTGLFYGNYQDPIRINGGVRFTF